MKKLIIVASPPASGKTYVSEKLAGKLFSAVYLDKDDLADLVKCAFQIGGQCVNMDGAFYAKNIRPAEYSTILNIAFSTLRFADNVILNGPFTKEVRDPAYMSMLKKRAEAYGAELVLIWVFASAEICHERMIRRAAERDAQKLKNFEEYVKNIDYSPPYALEQENSVSRLIVVDARSDEATEASIVKALEILKNE